MRRLTVFVNAGPWLPVPPSGYGGVENMLFYLIRELRERHGHRVILGTVGDSRIQAERSVSFFQEGQHRHMTAPYCDTVGLACMHMQRVLKTIRSTPAIDVVHDFVEVIGPSMLAQLGPDGPPVLHTLQWNLSGHRDFYGNFEGRRVFFNGISGPQMAAATSNIRRKHLGVVHNGVDVDDFQFRRDKDDYLITLARFTYDKGQDIAARVCADLGIPLLMAGTVGGIDEPHLLAKELGDPVSPFRHYKDVQYYREHVQPYERKHPRICWVGGVGGDRKRTLMAGARALLMPIRWEEPFGMAVIEALASGTPVVAMRRGAMPVIIRDGYNGFLADDEEQFKNCIQKVGEIDPANCRRSVEERFSAARMARRYLALYGQLLERVGAAGSRATAAPAGNGNASAAAELAPRPR
jgi:glycosyltransferase involved in cell wall biosynthesis